MAQIIDQQASKNLSFEDAFNATIISWHDDLKLKWDGNWSLEDTSLLIKKTSKQKSYSILKKAIIIAVICQVMMILFYVLMPFEVFRIIYGVSSGVLMLFPLIVFLKEKKYFDLPKKYKNITLSAYQNLVAIFFIFPMSSSWWVFRFVFEMNDGFLNFVSFKGISVNFIILFYFFFQTSCIIAQQKYLEMIRKVKPYLKEHFKVSE
ncbi:hypothetical protein [Chryseobacterium sp.]|uniref:hypothetical protein n=1 Tax=Chryseobacterium sp. TaxID=1871047 RepID=UPI0028A19B07|nr:hypothetical protein [Chryseobacterium sp.]